MRFPTFPSLLVLVWLWTRYSGVSSYVTSYSAVPAKKQLQWLKQMTTELCESQPGQLTEDMLQIAPDLMLAWTKHSSKESALAVESIVKRVIDERRAGNGKAIAKTADYNCLLESWSRASRAGQAGPAERCEQILTQMQDAYQQGQSHVQPNLKTFKTVLIAWRRSGVSYAPLRAWRILQWMVQLYQDSQGVLPDSDCFDICLQTFAQSSQPPTHAEKLLAGMERLYLATEDERLKPRTASFNAVLTAWGRSNRVEAADRSLDLLGFMELLRDIEEEVVAPNMATYSTVLGTLARSTHQHNYGPAAEQVLWRVVDGYRHGIIPYEPESILFNAAMRCWAKAKTPGAYRRARSILDKQIDHYEHDGCSHCKPDDYSYTTVMETCAAEPNEQLKAFHVALSTFHLARRARAANHVTYGTMLKACARLLPSKSPLCEKWTRKVFVQCVQDGYAGDMVLSRLREAATPELYKELMQGHSRKQIPPHWKRSVQKDLVRKKGFHGRKREV